MAVGNNRKGAEGKKSASRRVQDFCAAHKWELVALLAGLGLTGVAAAPKLYEEYQWHMTPTVESSPPPPPLDPMSLDGDYHKR
jgi:hypothetical protein